MNQKRRKNSTNWLVYLALRSLICLIHCARLESCDRICRILAKILADYVPLRRRVIDENLLRAYQNLSPLQSSQLRQQMWHHLLLMICEIAHAPRKIHRTNWRDHVYMPNKDAHMTLLLEDHANIIVTGHFGNFEAAGYITGLLGIKSSAIARPLDNPYVDEYLVRFRSSTGQSILPKEGSASAIEKLLENKGCLTILADQHAGDRGCWVDFFGHLTSCHKALALFVLTGGVPMTVCYARRLDRPLRFEIGITGVADPRHAGRAEQQGIHDSIESVTAWYNRCLEQAIRKAPEQYWWLHRRWRTVPPAVLKRLAKRSNTTDTHRTN